MRIAQLPSQEGIMSSAISFLSSGLHIQSSSDKLYVPTPYKNPVSVFQALLSPADSISAIRFHDGHHPDMGGGKSRDNSRVIIAFNEDILYIFGSRL